MPINPLQTEYDGHNSKNKLIENTVILTFQNSMSTIDTKTEE